MRNNRRRNVSTHAQVNFSQSETSSLLRWVGGGELSFELLLWWGGGVVNRKDPGSLLIYANVDSQVAICKLAASQPTLQLTIPERFQQKATKHIEMCPSVHPRTKVVKKFMNAYSW